MQVSRVIKTPDRLHTQTCGFNLTDGGPDAAFAKNPSALLSLSCYCGSRRLGLRALIPIFPSSTPGSGGCRGERGLAETATSPEEMLLALKWAPESGGGTSEKRPLDESVLETSQQCGKTVSNRRIAIIIRFLRVFGCGSALDASDCVRCILPRGTSRPCEVLMTYTGYFLFRCQPSRQWLL